MAIKLTGYNTQIYDDEIEGIKKLGDTQIGQVNTSYDTQIANETKTAEKNILSADQNYDAQVNKNAVQAVLNERAIRRSMAKSGMTNSGLNFTQQTAVATQRMNADNSTMQYYNNAVNTLRSNLQSAIAQNNQQLQSNIASVQYENEQKKADIKANTASANAQVKTELKTNAKDITSTILSKVSSTSDKGTNAQQIFTYANTYGLSDKTVKRLLGIAGISWSDYNKWIKNRNFFSVAVTSSKSTNSSENTTNGTTTTENNNTESDKQFENALKTISLHFRGNSEYFEQDSMSADFLEEWFEENIEKVYTKLSKKQLKTLLNRLESQYTIKG